EIILQIFQIIYYSKPKNRPYEQYQTLRTCLLVNRFWCINVTSILWSRVFAANSLVRLGAINKYISCLKPEKFQYLLDAGMKFSKRTEYNQLFDYPSFLKELQFDIFLKDLSIWCIENGSYHCHNLKFHNLVLKTLLELFSERGAKLEIFYMKQVYKSAFPSYHTELRYLDFNVLTSVNIKGMFANCKKIRLEGDVLMINNIIDIFTKIFNNVEHLTLDSPNIGPKILQNNFLNPTSYTILNDDEIDKKQIISTILSKSFSITQSNSLTCLIISQRKLKTLVLSNQSPVNHLPFHHTIQMI
ncbi:38329_t:CDS:1, partial [Gigaspora margarita]